MLSTQSTKITKVISYNLRKGKASADLKSLVLVYNVDFLCLQEINSATAPQSIGPLILADMTTTQRLGLALYYNPHTYTLVKTKGYALRKSMHDYILAPAEQRLLVGSFTRVSDHTPLAIASFHASPLSATNSLRRKQIAAAHDLLDKFSLGTPILMAGDYNYPLFKKKLKNAVTENGYSMTLSDKLTYTRMLPGHFDFITSANATIQGVKTLPKGISDHRPILISMSV